MSKFLLITGAGILGNGIGALNIRTIASGRLWLTALFTFLAATINMAAIRDISRSISGIYIIAWAMGSVIGICGTVYMDKKWLDRSKAQCQNI